MSDKHPLFPLGQFYCTPGALAALCTAHVDALGFITRHVTGDWAEMDEADQEANRLAVEEGSRVFSAYRLPSGEKLWVITEADRSATTLLRPDEY